MKDILGMASTTASTTSMTQMLTNEAKLNELLHNLPVVPTMTHWDVEVLDGFTGHQRLIVSKFPSIQ